MTKIAIAVDGDETYPVYRYGGAYGIDFGELSQGGLVYQTESNGLIGVAHKGAYDHASAETNVMCGLQLIAENTGYIGKFTFTPDA